MDEEETFGIKQGLCHTPESVRYTGKPAPM